MSVQPLAQTLEERIVLPQNETALPVLTEPALFTFHDRLPTVRTDTNNLAFHKCIRSFFHFRVLYQFGNHRIDLSHKFTRLHFAALNTQQLRFPIGGHFRGLDLFGHHSNEGFALVRGQKHLVFLGALAFQKTLLHQFFDGGGSGCRGTDALTLHALRHTVRTGGLHSVQQGVL